MLILSLILLILSLVLLISLYSLLFRTCFTNLVKCVRFSSKSFETVFIIFSICSIYYIVYCVNYMASPFYYQPESY